MRIKSDLTTKDIPIVIQTAFGKRAIAERAMKAGASEILSKPITIAQVQAVLKKYLSAEGSAPAVQSSTVTGAAATG